MYNVSVFNRKELSKLRDEWLSLEKGLEMTYFQSYHWNLMLTKKTPDDSKTYEAIYCLVRNQEEKAVLIAPLWVIKSTFRIFNKKGVYLIGRQGWSDYLNLIYKDFDPHAVSFLFQWLRNTFHIRRFFFEYLKETSSLYLYIRDHCIIKNSQIVNKNSIIPCVHIPLPDSVDSYHKTLSRNSRQALHKACNRLQREGHSITFNFNDKPDLELCKQMRDWRVAEKNKRKYTFWGKLKGYIRKMCVLEFPTYLPFYEDVQSRFMTVSIDGEFCAFFNYGLDQEHEEIVIMAVGTHKEYLRYSPGILLLYEYIKYQITEREIKNVDLTRGDERYKYTLGGNSHFLQTVNFELP